MTLGVDGKVKDFSDHPFQSLDACLGAVHKLIVGKSEEEIFDNYKIDGTACLREPAGQDN